MARQAEAERLRRAKVISAEGEFQAAARLGEAAAVMEKESVAIQLRMLQTLGADRHGEEPHRDRAVPRRSHPRPRRRRARRPEPSVDRERVRAAPPARAWRRSAPTRWRSFPPRRSARARTTSSTAIASSSDFYYLTGFPEPGAVCVLLPGHAERRVRPVRAPARPREARPGRAGAPASRARSTEYGAAMAYPIEELDQRAAADDRRARPALLRRRTATRRSRGA